MKMELLKVFPDGSGTMLVHLDSGGSMQQNFEGAPVEDAVALQTFLSDIATVVADRNAPKPAGKVVPQEVRDMVGKQIDVPRTKGETLDAPR